MGEGYAGWAPLGYSDDNYFPDDSWRFVQANQLLAVLPAHLRERQPARRGGRGRPRPAGLAAGRRDHARLGRP